MSEARQAGFDYAGVAEASALVALRDDIRGRMKRSAADIVEIGRRLAEAKALLPHGRFIPWCESELDGLSHDTAGRFVRVAERFGQMPQVAERVSPSALYALASGTVPDDVREGFVARAESGERITHAMVREAIAASTVGSIEPAHRHAVPIEDVLPPDARESLRRTRVRSLVSSVKSRVRSDLIAIPPEAYADVADDDDMAGLDRLVLDLADWVRRVKAARPNGLRMIQGGR